MAENTIRPVRSLLLLIGFCLPSFLLAPSIPLGYLPDNGLNAITVQVDYEGAFEEQIEQEITIPLENELLRVSGLRLIRSVSERGRSSVFLKFTDAVILSDAYLQVRDAVDRVAANFPDRVRRPLLRKSDSGARPVFIASFPMDSGLSEEELKHRLEHVKGTGSVETGGVPKEELAIEFDDERIASASVTVRNLLDTVAGYHFAASVGRETGAPFRLDFRMTGPEGFADLPVAPGAYLGDFSRIRLRKTEPDSITWHDGRPRIIAYVQQAGDANTVELCRDLRRTIAEIDGAGIILDAGAEIERSLRQVAFSTLIGIALVVGLVTLFLGGIRHALPVLLCIPFSVACTIPVLRGTGSGIDIMSLSGLAVGIGTAVDTVIIVLEDHAAHGGRPTDTLRRVAGPVLTSACSTALVFLPLVFAPPKLRFRFGGLALTVTACLAGSLLYAFLLLPGFLERLPPLPSAGGSPVETGARRYRSMRSICRFIGRFRIGMIAASTGVLCAAGFAFAVARIDPAGLPVEKNLGCSLEFPSGTPLRTVLEDARGFAAAAGALDGVAGSGIRFEAERAVIDLVLTPDASVPEVKHRLRESSRPVPGAVLFFTGDDSETASFPIILTGPSNSTLRTLAAELAARIALRIDHGETVFHFKRQAQVLFVRIDPFRASFAGSSPAGIHRYLYHALARPVVGKWYPGSGDGYRDIRIASAAAPLMEPQDLPRLSVPVSDGGGSVPLGSVAVIEEKEVTGSIARYGRRRSASFTIVVPRRQLARAIGAAKEELAGFSFPPEYRAVAAPEENERKAMIRSLILLLLLSAALVFLLLLFLFEHVLPALLCMLQIPFSFAVPCIVFPLSGIAFTTPVFIGLVLTAGIAVNNGILVLHEAGGRELSGGRVQQAFLAKLPSILIASFTTIGGILPLLLGTEASTGILAPLSLTIGLGVGGSLLFLPVTLFSIFPVYSSGDSADRQCVPHIPLPH